MNIVKMEYHKFRRGISPVVIEPLQNLRYTFFGSSISNGKPGIVIKPKAPTRIGASMGRPEKAKARKMSPPPHVLFPVGEHGGPQRLVNKAVEKGKYEVQAQSRRCPTCGNLTPLLRCPCGARTQFEEDANGFSNLMLSAKEAYAAAGERMGLTDIKKMKGVKGLISKEKIPEPLEKGFLRVKQPAPLGRPVVLVPEHRHS